MTIGSQGRRPRLSPSEHYLAGGAGHRQRLVFDEAPVGLAKVGPDGSFLAVNRKFCELTGYSEEELSRKNAAEITHPDDPAENPWLVQQLLAGDLREMRADKRYLRSDGTVVWVRVRSRLVTTAEGAPAFIKVAEPLDERAGVPAPALQPLEYFDIQVDMGRLETSWNGAPLALSPKETLLLCYLIRHQGEIVTREALLQDVWGYSLDAKSRTLDAYVSKLRRKVPPLAELLMTIGRAGYTLRGDPQRGRGPLRR